MDSVDLEQFLGRPLCPRCGCTRTRPEEIYDENVLVFNCPNPGCGWRGRAKLPEIQKEILYLDTSVVSHIARALDREESNGPWIDLYEILREATDLEVLCCPCSSMIEQEADLANSANTIVRLSRELGDPGLRHHLAVREAQLHRALGRFLEGQPAQIEAKFPTADAFGYPIHDWLPSVQVFVNSRSLPEWIDANRRDREVARDAVDRAFNRYAANDVPFDAIVEEESQAVGAALASNRGHTFESVAVQIMSRNEEDPQRARERAQAFFLSEHFTLLPSVQITARLYAALALLCRGPSPRQTRASDIADITHIATYAPYVDVLIADRFFAEICGQNHLRIGEMYSCDIRTLTPSTIPDLVGEIQELISTAPQAKLKTRINSAIRDGCSPASLEN